MAMPVVRGRYSVLHVLPGHPGRLVLVLPSLFVDAMAYRGIVLHRMGVLKASGMVGPLPKTS